jgi:NTP pyrophosphatase (non-canonical NTP hydrolase)
VAESLADMMAEVVKVNEVNGWYEREVPFLEAMWLLGSEVYEAGEAYREHGMDDMTRVFDAAGDGNPKPEGVGSEFADVFIRLLDYCHRYGVDLEFEYRRKLAYNATRGYRHGGKQA